MLVPYARKNHTVSNFNPFHDFDELERAFFSDNALSEFKTDIQEDGDNFCPASRRRTSTSTWPTTV